MLGYGRTPAGEAVAAPALSTGRDAFSVLGYGDASPEEAPSTFDRVLHGLETVTAPLGYAKRGVDALARAGSRWQGLDVPDTATTGSLFRTGIGLDPSQGEFAQSVTGRLLGKGAEFGTDIATDPLTWALGGASKVAGAGRALEGTEALMSAEQATRALKTIEAGRKAALVGRGAAAAFAPGLVLGGVREGREAYDRYKAGDLPGAAEAALGAGLSGTFGLLSASHALHGEAPIPDTAVEDRPVAQGFAGETRPQRNFTQETLPDVYEGAVPPEFQPPSPMLIDPNQVRADLSGQPDIFPGTGDPLRDAELAGGNARAQASAEEAQLAAMLEARAKARAAAQKTPEEVAADIESLKAPNVWDGPEQPIEQPQITPAEVAADLRGEERPVPAPEQPPVPMLGYDQIPADQAPPAEETPGTQPVQAAAPPPAPIAPPEPTVPEQRTVDRREFQEPIQGPDQRTAARRTAIAQKAGLPEDHPAVSMVMDAEADAGASKKEARTDPLTGLGNKRHWEELQGTVTPDDHVVIFDLKQFKPFNDRYGHKAGDQVLRRVGAIAREVIGEETSRFGGDEFGGVIRKATPERVKAIQDEIVRRAADSPITLKNPKTGETVDIPGFEVHIAGGADAEAADLAVNTVAEASRKGGRGDIALPGESPVDRSVEAAPGPDRAGLGNRPPELDRREFQEPIPPGSDQRAKLSTQPLLKTAPDSAPAPPDREAVRAKLSKIFKGQKVEDARVTADSPIEPNSPFVVRTPSGKKIFIEPTGRIDFNLASAERHGPGVVAAIEAGEARAAGSMQSIGPDAWVKIVDEGVLPHEIGGHVFLEHFSTPAERSFIEKHYGKEADQRGAAFDELFADDYNAWWDKRQEPTSALRNVFTRIRDFFERMKRAVGFESREGLFREIESGRPFDRAESEAPRTLQPIPLDATGRPKFATAAVPKAEPVAPPGPMGKTMAEAGVEAPRVESKVEALREIKPNVELSRDEPRSWASLDPKIRKNLEKIQRDPTEEVRLFSRAKEGKLDDVDVMTLDALVSGKNEKMASARDAMVQAQEKGNAMPERVAYLKSLFDASVADLAKAARSDVEAGTKLARALAARARVMNAVVLGDTDSVLRKIFREIPDISNEQAGNLAEVLQKGSATDAQAALHNALNPKTLNKWIEAWKNGLVSAPGTQVANIFGNIAEATTRILETATAAAVDPLLGGPKTRLAGEAKYELRGSLKGAGDSMGRLASDLKDIFTLAPEKIDLLQPFERQTGAIGGKFGRGVRIPFRLLGAFDQFFKGVGQQAELNKLAYRLHKGDLAAAEKMSNTPFAELPESIQKQLIASAQERTFQNPNEGAKAFSRLRNQFPILHIIAPFIETPLNIANITVKRSPYGFIEASKAYRAYRAAVNAGESAETISRLKGEAVDKIARPLMGTAIMATFAAVAQSGAMTGSGPTDPKEANALKDGGWQPYSFVVTGTDGKRTYIPYNRFEPVSSLLGFAADMVEAKGAKDKAALFDKGMGSIGQNLFSKTYLQGIAEAASAIHDPKQFADQYVSNLAGSIVPNIVSKVTQTIDPTLRDVRPGEGGTIERIGKTIVSRIPGASTLLPARRSGTGQTIERPGNPVTRLLSPVQVTGEKENLPFQEMLVNTEAVPTAPRKEIRIQGKDVALTNEEFKALQDADQATTKQLEKLFRAPSFKALPTERRKQLIDSRYNQGRSAARSRITASPAFRKRLSAELRAH